LETFTDFKKNFYSRVPDFSLFDCGDINLLKVVLDGLKVNYCSKGKVKAYFFYPLFLYKLISKIKYSRVKDDENLKRFFALTLYKKNKTVLVSDVGRIITNFENTPKSLYFDNIIKIVGREKVLIVADNVIDKRIDCDINLKSINDFFINSPLILEEIALRKNLLDTFVKIKKSKIFTDQELKNIKIAFHLFFNQYKIWRHLLEHFPNLNTAYFTCHYHKEGQIHALKKNGIACVELQHGLIAPQDIFYIFPKTISNIKSKALFADKILVYGKHWKDVLLKGAEYSENQIEILGYYLFDDFKGFKSERNQLEKIIDNREVILVTTQTFLHEYFIEFISRLEQKLVKENSNFILLIKPHPSENIEIYKNAFCNSAIIKIVQFPLPLLFEQTKIHISIYSTTLYDALRFNIRNYVFKAKGCEDYVGEIISSGIAEEIINIDDFFNSIQTPKSVTNQSLDFYAKMDAFILNKN
jgi:hypothetical protein